jgi:hypothetical protein
MKIIYASLALFSSKALAEKVGGRKIGQTKDMLSVKLGISVEDAKDLVRSYGCYCYPHNQKNVGPSENHPYNGAPMDELDELCKKLYRAQKCVNLDSDAGKWTLPCTLDNAYQFYQDNNGKVICENPNEKNPENKACKVNMCELENDFTDKVVALFNSGWQRNDDYFKWDENEYANRCQKAPQVGNSQQSELACCGEGLQRKTFNSLVNQCCDNEVQSIGAC